MRNISLFFIAYAIFVNAAFGQFQLKEKPNMFGSVKMAKNFCVDVDLDGDIDLLNPSVFTPKHIPWYENDNGQFGINLLEGSQYVTLAYDTCKFNSDGLIDVIVTNNLDQIFIHVNNGSGFDGFEVSNQGVDEIEFVDACDFNNDSHMDFLLSTQDDELYLFQGDGTGVFQKILIPGAIGTLMNNSAHDYNNDGNIDFLLFSVSGSPIMTTYFGDGASSFTSSSSQGLTTTLGLNVIANDMDNDGFLDVVFPAILGTSTYYMKNDGFGSFSSESIDSHGTQIKLMDVYDYNQDGLVDFIVYTKNTPNTDLHWFRNTGSGFVKTLISNFPPEFSSNFKTVDLNGSGVHSYVNFLNLDPLNSSLRQEAIIAYSPNLIETPLVYGDYTSALKMAMYDMNRDGLDDIVYLNSKQLRIYYNHGNGSYYPEVFVDLIGVNFQNSFKLVDLNEDNFMDIVLVNPNRVYENFGTGLIEHTTPVFSGDRKFRVVDINEDGYLDIVSGGGGIYLHDGDFGFSQAINFSNGNPTSVISTEVFDLNSDGLLDVISAEYVSGGSVNIRSCLNNGDSTFTNQVVQNISIGTDYELISFTDYTHDGYIDFVVLSELQGPVLGYTGDSLLNFSVDRVIANSSHYRLLAVGDFNLDGMEDAIFPKFTGAPFPFLNSIQLVYHESLSTNEYTLGIRSASQFYGSDFDLLDFDQDGDLDFSYAYSFSGEMRSIGVVYNHAINSPFISGIVFYDSNQNAILDSSEIGLFGQRINNSTTNTSSFTNFLGKFMLTGNSGLHQIEADIDASLWNVTTSNSSLGIFVDSLGFSGHHIGLYPSNFIDDYATELISPNVRCFEESNQYLVFRNTGTSFLSPQLKVTIPNSLQTFGSVSSHDSIVGQSLYFSVPSLAPTDQIILSWSFTVDNAQLIGDTLPVIVESSAGGIVKLDTLMFEITCAYDPNDKSFLADNQYHQTYQFSESRDSLEYMVRFQNTGSSYAKNVRIKDVLSSKFDLNSIRNFTASHNVEVSLNESTRELEFYFPNIMLVQSDVDYEKSMGYVLFDVDLINTIADTLNNQASIYFDYNSPILTNVSKAYFLDSESTTVKEDPILEIWSNIYPNPTSSGLFLNIDLKKVENFQVEILNAFGQTMVRRELNDFQSGIVQFNVQDFAEGVYFVRLSNQNATKVLRFVKKN